MERLEPTRIDPPRREPPRQDPSSDHPPEKDPPSREPPAKEPGRADQEKQAAARASMRFVHDGQIVGLGTGSTAVHAIRLLGERVHQGLKIVGIPTSQRSKELAESLRIPLATFDDYQEIDVNIDGADEFDPGLRLIKGGGGALLREKIVASASKLFVVVADSSKQVAVLGKFPLPVEVIPFAQALLVKRISALGATVTLREDAYGNPFITDEGHHILDCHFGQIPDPPALARTLSDLPGVVEHGLFINMAGVVLLGKGSEVVELRRKELGTAGK
jgi:ribose 5-phosphate isomerase A